MNPKLTEFLAQDRIATFRDEALGHHLQARSATTRPQAPEAPSTKHATKFTLAWRRIRAAMTV
jgi:hypothetical protein